MRTSMKSIQLHTARADNGGSFRDGGSTLDVGDDADQIDADTAKALVDGGLASVLAAAGVKETPKGKDGQ